MMKDVWKELIVERGGLLKNQHDAFTKVFLLLLRIYFRLSYFSDENVGVFIILDGTA